MELQQEKWASLDHLGLYNYAVSTYGRILNIKTKQELKGSLEWLDLEIGT